MFLKAWQEPDISGPSLKCHDFHVLGIVARFQEQVRKLVHVVLGKVKRGEAATLFILVDSYQQGELRASFLGVEVVRPPSGQEQREDKTLEADSETTWRHSVCSRRTAQDENFNDTECEGSNEVEWPLSIESDGEWVPSTHRTASTRGFPSCSSCSRWLRILSHVFLHSFYRSGQ